MLETRSARRLRLACEPCRRKKTRCPGEKPACSFCARLGQKCTYTESAGSAEPQHALRSSDVESRINGIEDKLDRLIDHISSGESPIPCQRRPRPQAVSPVSLTPVANQSLPDGSNSSTDESSGERKLRETGRLYLTWCHKQPMQLFNADSFLEKLQSRDKELMLAVEALALRFPPGFLTESKQQRADALATEARRLVMDRVVNSDTRLSSMQTLCMLSMYNFTGGNIEKARLDLTIADHLRTSSHTDIATGQSYGEETKLCLRSIESLQKMHGCSAQATRLMSVLRDRHEGVILPEVLGSRPDSELNDAIYGELGGFASRLSDTWQMIRAYASSRVNPDSVPPWDSRSDYNIVMQSHLRIDCAVPLKYRFSPENDMNNQTPEALQRNRQHWSTLLFLQMVYATVLCILNHPFLLSKRLRNFRHTIPQSFVQQSYEHITRHAGWITYYISVAEKKNFQPTDPCLAHCVVIVATIYIQHSFVKTAQVRERSKSGLDTCLRFLDQMGLIWPVVATMARNVRRLQQSVVPSPVPVGSSPPSDQAFSIDAQLLWDLLIYDRAGLPNAGIKDAHTSATGSLNTTHGSNAQENSTEFDLVGSAGISGHRSAGAHIPVYAPGDESQTAYSTLTPALDAHESSLPNLGGSMEDVYGFGVDGINDQMAPLFLADDYGRAIDGWLNYF